MAEVVFGVLAALAVLGAGGVVLGRNPVGSLISMVLTLGSLAGIFVLLEAHFLAAVQVIVYAGAIMVLFMFVIMLLNLGHEYVPDLRRGVWVLLAFAVSGALGGLLVRQVRSAGGPVFDALPGAAEIDQGLMDYGAVGVIARPLFTDWVVPFEITGVLLLVAVVGALVLAKKRV